MTLREEIEALAREWERSIARCDRDPGYEDSKGRAVLIGSEARTIQGHADALRSALARTGEATGDPDARVKKGFRIGIEAAAKVSGRCVFTQITGLERLHLTGAERDDWIVRATARKVLALVAAEIRALRERKDDREEPAATTTEGTREARRAGYAPKGGETVHAISTIDPHRSLCDREVSPIGADFEPESAYSCRRCVRLNADPAPPAALPGDHGAKEER